MSESKRMTTKPLSIRVEDYKRQLRDITSQSALPAFILEMILGEFLTGINRLSEAQYKTDIQEWSNHLGEMTEKRGESENG